MNDSSSVDVSPYLRQPLRTLAEAQAEHDAAVFRRRARLLRTSDGQPLEPRLPLEILKQRQALADGLPLPAKDCADAKHTG